MAELLVDFLIDFKTGRAVIDTATGDAALISGPDVILQDTAIRVRTQIGTIKRQGIDDFGWDIFGVLKSALNLSDITSISNKITEVALEDDRVLDATVEINQAFVNDEITFILKIKVENERWLSLPLTFQLV